MVIPIERDFCNNADHPDHNGERYGDFNMDAPASAFIEIY